MDGSGRRRRPGDHARCSVVSLVVSVGLADTVMSTIGCDTDRAVGTRGPHGPNLTGAPSAPRELRVPGHAVLVDVEALDLLLFGDPQLPHRLQDTEQDRGRDSHPGGHTDDADDLRDDQLRAAAEEQTTFGRRETDPQGAEDAAGAVN